MEDDDDFSAKPPLEFANELQSVEQQSDSSRELRDLQVSPQCKIGIERANSGECVFGESLASVGFALDNSKLSVEEEEQGIQLINAERRERNTHFGNLGMGLESEITGVLPETLQLESVLDSGDSRVKIESENKEEPSSAGPCNALEEFGYSETVNRDDDKLIRPGVEQYHSVGESGDVQADTERDGKLLNSNQSEYLCDSGQNLGDYTSTDQGELMSEFGAHEAKGKENVIGSKKHDNILDLDDSQQKEQQKLSMNTGPCELVPELTYLEEKNREEDKGAPMGTERCDIMLDSGNSRNEIETMDKVECEPNVGLANTEDCRTILDLTHSQRILTVDNSESINELYSAQAFNALENAPDGICQETNNEEETTTVDSRLEIEAVAKAEAEMEVDIGRENVGKRKRGRYAKKMVDEDVCFICFDGGDLVLCDRRRCPKAYHPSCVNRDDAFFRAKGRWNCGWHICSICKKNSHYMCFTCTFSLCKGCIKDAVILCVRGNKGFCEPCLKTVMLIEKNDQGNKDMDMVQVDFDDKGSWEYLFKDYWLDLKGNLSITLEELVHARNPWRAADELPDTNNDEEFGSGNSSGNEEKANIRTKKAKKRSKLVKGFSPSASDGSFGNVETNNIKGRKVKKLSKSLAKEGESSSAISEVVADKMSTQNITEWASKELLEFVMHMKDGDTSIVSQFDVQALLLEYIKRNKLRDPRRKSQIICDSRLQKLFAKPRVGHFEMLKLIESHFLSREDPQADDLQGSVVDTDVNQMEADGSAEGLVKTGKDRKRKARKKGDERELQSNINDYAAINIHNINLVYLRRNLMETLVEDAESFHEKVVGTFVRIRISCSVQNKDMYRLVQVIGTGHASEPYRVGKRMTDITLEILNLDKTEFISIDIISNQEFSEDECKRLRQSIKCKLMNSPTVGEIQEKAMTLQSARVNDWLETEIVRLSHLRDRASEKGRKKELRECVEKLQLLRTPEERQRRLEETPEIHADPKMDPSYESEDDQDETDGKREDGFGRPRSDSFNRRWRDPISPKNMSSVYSDSWSGTRNYSSKNQELNRSFNGRGFSHRREDSSLTGDTANESSWSQGRDRDMLHMSSSEKQKPASNSEALGRNSLSESLPRMASETSPPSLPSSSAASKIGETQKIWHYQDPSGKFQGPFSMVQLRKWSNTGYFPKDLRIWKAAEKQEDSILLTDALGGKFEKDPSPMESGAANVQKIHSHHLLSSYNESVRSTDTPKVPLNGSSSVSRIDSSNLPSPTPTQSNAGRAGEETCESKPSANSLPFQQCVSLSGPNASQTTFSEQTGPVSRRHDATEPANGCPGSVRGSNVASQAEMVTSSTHSAQGPPPTLFGVPMLHGAAPNPGTDPKVLGTCPQTPNSSVEAQAWGHAPPEKQEQCNPATLTPQRPTMGQWGVPGVPPNSWRPVQVNQPNMQQAPPANQPWGQIPGNPNMGWGGPMPGNANMCWASPSQGPPPGNVNPGWMPAQGPPAGSPNLGWVAPGNNPNMGWVPPGHGVAGPGNMNPGWFIPGQGQTPGNTNPMWVGPGNTNPGWGAPGQSPQPGNANPGWVAPPGQSPQCGNANPSWVAPPGQSPQCGNANPCWVAPPGQSPQCGNANPGWVAPPSQSPQCGNANPGWVAPGQNPQCGNANLGWTGHHQGQPQQPPPPPQSGNVNQNWSAPSQAQANDNSGWIAPSGKASRWGPEKQQEGERSSGRSRGRSSRGGDSGSGGSRSRNRQSSFNGKGGEDSSSPRPPKGEKTCPFLLHGYCRKGANCDFLHP